MAITASDILEAQDSPLKEVLTPEWEPKTPKVYIRVLSGVERDKWEEDNYIINKDDVKLNRDNVRARLLVKCLADENGNRLFKDVDAAALGKKSAVVLFRLYKLAEEHNCLGPKDLADKSKNSGSGQTDSPATGLAAATV